MINFDFQPKENLLSKMICPICRASMMLHQRSVHCENGHTFDFAKEWYLHLLPANQMHKKIPGDSAKMVKARHDFLAGGYYQNLQNTICQTILKYNSQQSTRILDIGCGEGYYTEAVGQALGQANGCEICGIDISKSAVRYTAKRFQKLDVKSLFSVASAYHLPFANSVFDMALNVFSPLCISEIFRVMRSGGYFFYVVPAPRHLWQLKEALYEIPYENKDDTQQYDGFTLCDKIEISNTVFLPNQEAIQSLFAMTPYAWRSPKSGVARLSTLQNMTLELSFYLYVYQKANII